MRWTEKGLKSLSTRKACRKTIWDVPKMVFWTMKRHVDRKALGEVFQVLCIGSRLGRIFRINDVIACSATLSIEAMLTKYVTHYFSFAADQLFFQLVKPLWSDVSIPIRLLFALPSRKCWFKDVRRIVIRP